MLITVLVVVPAVVAAIVLALVIVRVTLMQGMLWTRRGALIWAMVITLSP